MSRLWLALLVPTFCFFDHKAYAFHIEEDDCSDGEVHIDKMGQKLRLSIHIGDRNCAIHLPSSIQSLELIFQESSHSPHVGHLEFITAEKMNEIFISKGNINVEAISFNSLAYLNNFVIKDSAINIKRIVFSQLREINSMIWTEKLQEDKRADIPNLEMADHIALDTKSDLEVHLGGRVYSK